MQLAVLCAGPCGRGRRACPVQICVGVGAGGVPAAKDQMPCAAPVRAGAWILGRAQGWPKRTALPKTETPLGARARAARGCNVQVARGQGGAALYGISTGGGAWTGNILGRRARGKHERNLVRHAGSFVGVRGSSLAKRVHARRGRRAMPRAGPGRGPRLTAAPVVINGAGRRPAGTRPARAGPAAPHAGGGARRAGRAPARGRRPVLVRSEVLRGRPCRSCGCCCRRTSWPPAPAG